MKPGALLEALGTGAGRAIQWAGPAAAGLAAAGPLGAVLAVAGQASAAVEKRRGKAAEASREAPPVHKATAPAAAVGVPVGLGVLLASLGVDLPFGDLGILCNGGELSGAGEGLLMGLFALVSHQVGTGLQKAAGGRRGAQGGAVNDAPAL